MSDIRSELIAHDSKTGVMTYLSISICEWYNLFWLSRFDHNGNMLELKLVNFENETIH